MKFSRVICGEQEERQLLWKIGGKTQMPAGVLFNHLKWLMLLCRPIVHSYLILAYTGSDQAALNVGYYYMANAMGRLVGTLLSGLVFQFGGLVACLWVSAAFVVVAAVISLRLPRGRVATND